MKIRPVESLQTDWKAYGDYCNEFKEPVFLTEKGEGAYVLMSHKHYVNLRDKLESLNRRVMDFEYERGLYDDIKGLTLDEVIQRALGNYRDQETE